LKNRKAEISCTDPAIFFSLECRKLEISYVHPGTFFSLRKQKSWNLLHAAAFFSPEKQNSARRECIESARQRTLSFLLTEEGEGWRRFRTPVVGKTPLSSVEKCHLFRKIATTRLETRHSIQKDAKSLQKTCCNV